MSPGARGCAEGTPEVRRGSLRSSRMCPRAVQRERSVPRAVPRGAPSPRHRPAWRRASGHCLCPLPWNANTTHPAAGAGIPLQTRSALIAGSCCCDGDRQGKGEGTLNPAPGLSRSFANASPGLIFSHPCINKLFCSTCCNLVCSITTLRNVIKNLALIFYHSAQT